MTQHGALTTLKELAEKEVDNAALRLGEMRRGCQQAEEQLKMLMDYQLEYQNNLNTNMSQGMASLRWQNYQQFIQTLEKAIEQHRQQLSQWNNKVEQALTAWREKNSACRHGKRSQTDRPPQRCSRKTVSIRKKWMSLPSVQP
jgi:flagellar export protein FliJ